MQRLNVENVSPVFTDESYVKNGIYFVAASVVRKAKSPELAKDMRELLEELSIHGMSVDAEFHGYEMFHGEGDWAPLFKKPRLRIHAFRRLFQIMATHNVDVFIQGVHEGALNIKYGQAAFHPHEVSMHNLLCRLDEDLRPREHQIVVVADKIHEQDAREARMANFQKYGTMGWNACKLARISFPFVWADSKSHHELQIADVALFIHQRKVNVRQGDARAMEEVDRLHDLLRPRLRSFRVWHPGT
jgi:hypothetical protein